MGGVLGHLAQAVDLNSSHRSLWLSHPGIVLAIRDEFIHHGGQRIGFGAGVEINPTTHQCRECG